MKFDPTEKESQEIQNLFNGYHQVYCNLVKHFPEFKVLIDGLPNLDNINLILPELKPILADALCRVRNLADGSIEI